MMYPKGGGLLTRALHPPWSTKTMVLAVTALALLGTSVAVYATLPAHQAVNRADKADSLVASAELKAKHDVNVAWGRFFHDHQLWDPQAPNRFVSVVAADGASKDRQPAIVAVKERMSIAW